MTAAANQQTIGTCSSLSGRPTYLEEGVFRSRRARTTVGNIHEHPVAANLLLALFIRCWNTAASCMRGKNPLNPFCPVL